MSNNEVSKPFWIQCSTVKAVRAELLHTHVIDARSIDLVLSTLGVYLTFCVTKYGRLRVPVYTMHTHFDHELYLGIKSRSPCEVFEISTTLAAMRVVNRLRISSPLRVNNY
jgi:hypothetical protein